jgi:ABC-2 type transport system ATP-binding protein
MKAIELENIHVQYPASRKDESNIVALDGLSLDVDSEMLALLGPNGSGKSTLMGVISQSIKPQKGEVYSPKNRTALSVVFQTIALDQLLTIRENLMVAGALHGMPNAEIRTRLAQVAAQLGIEDRLDDQVRHLSGGLARRADIARALLPRPTVLLLDEPTTGLDIEARVSFWKSMNQICRDTQITIVLATHLIDEAEHCQRVVLMRDGRITKEGSPETLRSELGDRVLRVQCASHDQVTSTCNWLNTLNIRYRVFDQMILAVMVETDIVSNAPTDDVSITLSRPTLEDVYLWNAPEGTKSSSMRVGADS